MAVKISALPAAVGIDGVNDVLPIVQSGTTNKISRNTFLGITGSPIGNTDSQTLSNKTIGITNTVTILDSLFTIQDNGDNTKQAQFQLSGNTTGTTRTYTMPNASVTLASLTGTETFTNKTITSPIITGGTIDNSTITVDSIAGHTSGTIVTVANMQISNGVINSANAVTATSIASGAVQPQALVAGTGTGWTYQSYTVTWTNLTVGNGTVVARYSQIGKRVHFYIILTFGTTTAISGAVSASLPVPAVASIANLTPIGQAVYSQSGNNQGMCWLTSSTTFTPIVYQVSGTNIVSANLSATVPVTWNALGGSQILIAAEYEAA